MCRTAHALLQTVICGIQMLVRVFMTVILMIENVIRMLLQTMYNFISFLLQLISLVPICVTFILSARLKCFMCGGGGPCPVNRGGTCDCLMSAMAIVVLFLIFRATGVLDKIFYKLGYVKARPQAVIRFVPSPGDVTECSRNDTDENPKMLIEATETEEDDSDSDDSDYDETDTTNTTETGETPAGGRMNLDYDFTELVNASTTDYTESLEADVSDDTTTVKVPSRRTFKKVYPTKRGKTKKVKKSLLTSPMQKDHNWTTVLYYLL